MIAIDPTESRERTRLPQTVIEASIAVANLEQYTGADLLVSPLKVPIKDLDGSKPSLLLLQKHIDAGILIQRKSGLDFTSSIPQLASIQQRMQNPNELNLTRTPIHELMVIADLKVDRDGQAIVDGRESGYSWAAVQGAMLYWQLRGGIVSVIPRDNLVAGHLNGWLERLAKLQDSPTHTIVERVQYQSLLNHQDAWTETLATIPGIGADKARKIADKSGSLIRAIEWLLEPGEVKVEGIGAKTHASARNYFGVRDDEQWTVLLKEIKE